HRQRLGNTGAGTPQGYKGQDLRQSKCRQARYLRCADRWPKKPEKEAIQLEKGWSVLGPINVARIQPWVERVAFPAEPRRRGNDGFRVIEVARIEEITNEKSKLQGAHQHDASNAATLEPAQTARVGIER